MADDFKTRMRQRSQPTTSETSPSNVVTDAEMLFMKTGTTVQRPMTEEEKQSVTQGKRHYAGLTLKEGF